MKTYLVGGAVRDQQLNLPVTEKDWVVTGATTEEMLAKGFVQIDADFPVFKHPQTSEEYALARTEKKQGTGYKGFIVDSGPAVSLEQDLARRDLTINAIAMDEAGNLVDPYRGLEDLRDGKLRHVTEAFVEDPVRLIRAARFAAVLGQQGFSISHETFACMKQMSEAEELKTIKPERLLREMYKALAAAQCWKFFKVLGKCGALDLLLPGINHWINGKQMIHGEDAEPILALQRATKLTDDILVRLVAVMYQAVVTADFELGNYLPIEKNLQQLLAVVKQHGVDLLDGSNPEKLLVDLERSGAFKQGVLFNQVLLVLQAVFPEQLERINGLHQIRQQLKSVSSEDLMKKGFNGKQLGQEIQRQRRLLLEKWLGNS